MFYGPDEQGIGVIMAAEVQKASRLTTLLASPRIRFLLLAALVFLYTGWIGYQWVRDQLFDFNLYYVAAYGFEEGMDVYGLARDYTTTNFPHWQELADEAEVETFAPPYRYPPLTAQLVVPLLQFSERVAGTIWLALTALAYIISAWWLGRLWKQPEGASIVYLLTLGFVPTLTTLHAGQVNGFVLLALVAALAGLTYRNALLTGASLALAALFKLLPFALCLYLVWRKQWLAAVVAALVIIALMLSVPLMWGSELLGNYANNFLAAGGTGILYPTAANQGISGFWARTLAPFLDASTIYQIYLISVVILLLATLVLCWPMRNLPSFWRLEYSLIICMLMLIPPYNWYHMLLLLLIPLVVIAEYLWRKQHWTLLVLVLMLYFIMDVHGLVYHRFEHITWLMSFPFAFTMLLWGLLAWAIVAERKATGNVIADERKEQGLLASVPSHHV